MKCIRCKAGFCLVPEWDSCETTCNTTTMRTVIEDNGVV